MKKKPMITTITPSFMWGDFINNCFLSVKIRIIRMLNIL